MKEPTQNLFSGEKSEQYNALLSALYECAGGNENIYNFLEETPKTTLIVFLVDQLNDLGFKIIKQ